MSTKITLGQIAQIVTQVQQLDLLLTSLNRRERGVTVLDSFRSINEVEVNALRGIRRELKRLCAGFEDLVVVDTQPSVPPPVVLDANPPEEGEKGQTNERVVVRRVEQGTDH
jgi:hypothetical protein